jgi:hypothetical protein
MSWTGSAEVLPQQGIVLCPGQVLDQWISFLTVQACLQLLDDLFVHWAKGSLGRGRLGPALDVLEDVEQDLDRSQIGLGRAVDELHDCLAQRIEDLAVEQPVAQARSFRIAPALETGAERYAWLNNMRFPPNMV